MATIKKAQSGTRIDKTSTKKPKGTIVIKNKPKGDYISLAGKNPTKKDSADYKKGFDYGKSKPKNTLQTIFESPGWSAGNMEGRDDKRPMKKIKLQTGGSLGKIYTGPAKTNPGVLKAKADKAKATSNIKNAQSKAKVTFSKAVKAVKKKN